MAKIHGKNFAVYVDGDLVGDSRDCTINVNQNMVDTSSKEDANWSTKLPGMRDWSIDVAFLHDPSNTVSGEELFDLILNASQCVVEFSTGNATTDSTFYYGNAYASTASMTAPLDDAVNGSINFVGDGELNKGTVTTS